MPTAYSKYSQTGYVNHLYIGLQFNVLSHSRLDDSNMVAYIIGLCCLSFSLYVVLFIYLLNFFFWQTLLQNRLCTKSIYLNKRIAIT